MLYTKSSCSGSLCTLCPKKSNLAVLALLPCRRTCWYMSSLDCFTSAVNLLIIVFLYRMCFQVSTVSQFLCYHNSTISYSLTRPWILCKSHWVLQIFMNFQLTRRITNLRDGIFHFQDTHVSHREWVMVAVICYCDAISETTLGIVVSLSRKLMSSTSICYRTVCLRVFH